MTQTDPLRAYLAEQDVPCPGCGYNLRGAQDAVCPECGGPVALTIGRRYTGVWVLLLALLAWSAIGAGLDAARAVRTAFEEAQPSQMQVFSFGGSTSLRFSGSLAAGSVVLNRTSTGNIQVSPAPAATLTSASPTIQPPPSAVVVPGSSTVQSTPGAVRVFSAPGGRTRIVGGLGSAGTSRVWSQVAWPIWVALGGWGTLAAVGVLAVGAAIARRRTLILHGPGRRWIIASVALAALQVGVHTFLLVRELLA